MIPDGTSRIQESRDHSPSLSVCSKLQITAGQNLWSQPDQEKKEDFLH